MLDWSLKMDRAEVQAALKQAEIERARYVAAGLKALFGPVVRAVALVASAISEAKEASRLYAELSRMSDRQLEDIGISRSEIPAFVTRSVRHAEVPAQAANDDAAQAARLAA